MVLQELPEVLKAGPSRKATKKRKQVTIEYEVETEDIQQIKQRVKN
jgi:hypothetical protein